MSNIIIPSIIKPSYKQGYARSASESANSGLWRGLVGAWCPSLGVSGNTLFDVSGRGNHGTLKNMEASDWGVSNNQGYVLSYGGTDESTDTADLNSCDVGTGDFSVSVWVRDTLGGTTERGIVSRGQGGAGGKRYLLRQKGSPNRFEAEIDDDSVKVSVTDTGTSIVQNQWYHIVFTADRSGNGNIWINGVNTKTQSISGASGSLDDATATAFRIGRTTNNDTFFVGDIGVCLLYKRVITPNEIRQLYIDPHALFRQRPRILAVLPLSASGDTTGDTTITLPIFTIGSTALNHGTSSLTLPILTTSATSLNHSDSSLSLPIFTLDSTALSHGTSSLTMPTLTVASTALSHGTSSLTLPTPTADSTALSHGISSLTLPVITVSSTTTGAVEASLSLPQFNTDFTAHSDVDGSITLPQFNTDFTGHSDVDGSITLTIISVQGGSGATGNITLPIVSVLSSSGVNNASFDLPLLSVRGGSGATGSITLPVINVSSSGELHGVYNTALPAVTLSATSLNHSDASLSLPVFTINATSAAQVNSASITLPLPTLVSTAHSPIDVSLNLPIVAVQAVTGALADLNLPMITVSAGESEGADVTLPIISILSRGYKGSPPECTVMNTKNFAVSEYINYGFNSMARFNSSNLIADQNGIYEQDTTSQDDSAYNIPASIKSGEIDIYKQSQQRLRNAWVNYETDGNVKLVTKGDGTVTRNYPLTYQPALSGILERRIKFERGIKDRVFDFKLENINGSDVVITSMSVMLEPLIGKRR